LLFDEAQNRAAGYDGGCLYYFEDIGKRTSREPNAANLIGSYINERWPALKQFDKLWVTGSTVWRTAYAMPLDPGADLDVFVCDMQQYLTVVKFFRDFETIAPVEKRKRRGSNEGERMYTTRGWVDVWLPHPVGNVVVDEFPGEESHYDPFHSLRQYPPSTHGHCRIAYSPHSSALIALANEYANDEGAAEHHERAAQWHLEQAERLIKLQRRSA
jgi:hypothetical protein